MSTFEKIKDFFDNLSATQSTIERTVIDFVSAVTPWLAPFVPAYLVYYNATHRLDLPSWIAFILACAVEFLGLSAVHTALELWTHNQRTAAVLATEKSKKLTKTVRRFKFIPLALALFSGCFYVAIVLIVNALLDLFPADNNVKVIAHAMLSLLSVDAALIIAIRAQHRKQLAKVSAPKVARKMRQDAPKDDNFSGLPSDWRKLSPKQLEEIKDMTAEEIASRANISIRAAQLWVARSKNGHTKESA